MDSLYIKLTEYEKNHKQIERKSSQSNKMFVPKIIFLLYQISIGYSFEYLNFIPELVKDLILVDQTPSMVITTNSWNLKIISEIQKKYSIPIKFNFLNEKENQKHHKTFLADLNTEIGIQFVKNVDKFYFRHPNRWIIINNINKTDEDFFTMNELAVLPDSNLVIVDFIGIGKCKLQQGNITRMFPDSLKIN